VDFAPLLPAHTSHRSQVSGYSVRRRPSAALPPC